MGRPAWLVALTQQGEKPPYMLKVRSSNGFIIGTVALAVFTDLFLYGVIVPVIPFALQTRSHIEASKVQYWVSVLIAIYGASLLAFSPVCGWLADRSSSRRSPLLMGLVALLGSTVMLNVSSQIGVWVVARILQGCSAAVVWVVGLALLADTVPQENLAQAMGYVSLAMSLGILVAPMLGGIVFDRAGYNAVFAMAYALVGLDIVLRLLLIEKKVAARWDPGAAGRVRATTDDVFPPRTPAIDGSAPPTSDGKQERLAFSTSSSDLEKNVIKGPDPVSAGPTIPDEPVRRPMRDRLPPFLSLLYSRRLLSALFGSVIQATLFTSFDSVLTIRAASIFNWTSTGAALLFLPLVIPTFLAPLFGWFSDRFGARYPTALGFFLACPPLVCLRYVEHNTIEDKVTLCALLALIGLALAMTFPPLMAEISEIVESKEKKMLTNGEPGYGKSGAYAQAYALFNVAFAAGTMIGPLLAGFVVQEKGWRTMAWVLGLFSGFTGIPMFLWMGGWVFETS
ncbi:MFS transporter-like protein [Massariosphaeria phaeospora]|uniref:MFS transporter-like protein n=1 Tax=Massariosphaeria phaeospora TaxID=100035 RepID=A0A7C8I5U3_9PLEO|nr:MFS transporter-like protein [Massariosphaeria phaeospora]